MFSEYTEESEDFYGKGGLHPIEIGDEIGDKKNRYSIIHKLGHGVHSAVWLAKEITAGRNVSIKILQAAEFEDSEKELEVRRQLQAAKPKKKYTHEGWRFILDHFHDFEIQGPNGTHRCFVGEVVGPTIAQLLRWETRDLTVAKKFTWQLVHALDFLHSENISHGDIYPKNIAAKVSGLDSMSKDEIYENYGKPDGPILTIRKDGQKPPQLTQRMGFSKIKISSLSQIRIIDFGEAQSAEQDREELNTPPCYLAPESYLGGSIGLPADVWAFACTVFELFSASVLIGVNSFDRDMTGCLTDMFATLPHKFPDAYWSQWLAKDGEGLTEFFEQVGKNQYKCRLTGIPASLDQRIKSIKKSTKHMEDMEDTDVSGLYELLTRCLTYLPDKRATVKRVQSLRWVEGLPK